MTRSLLPVCVLLALACGGLPTPDPVVDPAPGVEDQPLEGFAYAPGPNGPRFTEWTGGETLFVAGPVPLRDGPDGAGTGMLELGAEVTVVAAEGESVEVDGVRNRWIRVRTQAGAEGFVFGGLLTPVGGTSAPTMDSDEFPWVVTFDRDFAPVLRAGSAEGPLTLALDPTDRFEGGRVEAETVGWGDFETRYQVALCRVDGGEEPACSTATARRGATELEQTTPPDPWKYLPESDDVTCEVESTLTWEPLTTPERLLDVQAPAYMRGTDGSWTCTAVGRVTSEVHRGRTVVSCVALDPGKSAPPSALVATYLKQDDAWIGIPCGSPEGVQSDLDDALAAERIQITHASAVGLPEDAFGPQTLTVPRGVAERAWMALAPEGTRVPLFDVPGHGPVFAIAEGDANNAGQGALFLGRPDGTAVRYAWDPGALEWPDEPPTALTYSAQTLGCDGFPERLVNVEEGVAASDLTPLARTADGTPVGVIADPEHPVNQRLFALYKTLTEADPSMRSDQLPAGQDLPTLLAGRPWLFVEDPWGRMVRLMREDFATPQMCEPIVYLYADPAVDFHLAPVAPLTFFRTVPEGLDGWTGTAGPDGTLTVDGRRWTELFWEGRSVQFPPPAEGVTVRGSDAEPVLREAAGQRGLIGHELDAFVDAWAPRLARHRWVRLGFHDPEDITIFAPLALDPPADTEIRVMLDASVVDGPSADPEALSRPPAVPERGAFTLVEWGGVLRDRR